MIRPGVKPVFRLALRRRDVVERQVDEEIALHLRLRARQLEAEGLPPEEAREEAERRFGDVSKARRMLQARARRRADHAWIDGWVHDLLQDLRFGARSLWHDRIASALLITTLALGIGVNATMFGVVNTLMFQPPPEVVHPERVVRIYFAVPKPSGAGFGYGATTSYGTYEALTRASHVFQDVAAYSRQETFVGRGADASRLSAVLVTESFFRTLGVQPILGRFFRLDEEGAAALPSVVLGYGLWKSRFNGDRTVLGRTIYVVGQPCRVIGVAPPHLTGVDLRRVDAWLPLGMATGMLSSDALSRTGSSLWLSTFARLRPGVSRAAGAAEATAALANDSANVLRLSGRRVALAPLPVGRGPDVPPDARVSLWLGLVSVLVLLVSCANAASLLLARAASHSHQVSVRLSLGAGRWRILRRSVVEGVMLAVCAFGAALLLMVWSSSVVRRVLMPDVAGVGHALPLRVTLFAGALAAGTALLCSLAPALIGGRSDLHPALNGHRQASPGHLRTQRLLVTSQVAFTVVLLTGAGLFVRSLVTVRSKDLGMDVRHALYASVDLQSQGDSQREALKTYREMLGRVRALPGVRAAGLSIGEPWGIGWGVSIVPMASAASRVEQPQAVPMGRAVGSGFFRATGQRFVAGRAFTAAEQASSAHVAIINEEAAHYYWGQTSPVGACIRAPLGDSGCFRIVGVVANTPTWQVTTPPRQELYVPLETVEGTLAVPRSIHLEVRTDGKPEAMVAGVRRAMMSAAGDTLFPSVEPLTDRIDPQYRSWDLGAEVFGALGLLALLLAAVGLYGVLRYAVVQRSQELAIRVALGAEPRALVRMVLMSGLLTTFVGTLIGTLAILAAGPFVAPLLYGVSPHDLLSLGCAAVVLLVVAGVASYLPAHRAARADPLRVMKAE